MEISLIKQQSYVDEYRQRKCDDKLAIDLSVDFDPEIDTTEMPPNIVCFKKKLRGKLRLFLIFKEVYLQNSDILDENDGSLFRNIPAQEESYDDIRDAFRRHLSKSGVSDKNAYDIMQRVKEYGNQLNLSSRDNVLSLSCSAFEEIIKRKSKKRDVALNTIVRDVPDVFRFLTWVFNDSKKEMPQWLKNWTSARTRIIYQQTVYPEMFNSPRE